MSCKTLRAVLITLPLLGSGCKPGGDSAGEAKATTPGEDPASRPSETTGRTECCTEDAKGAGPMAECCDKPDATPRPADPARQIVLDVEGLRCPAVKGIGCGHLLHPLLSALDKIDGVAASSTNYTGTMIRVSVAAAAGRDKVAERVRKVLTDKKLKAVARTGDDLKLALEKEQWRETGRVGELSAIEFRSIALHRVKAFAKAEKLDPGATDKLVKLAEDQWDRLAADAESEKATKPEDWLNRCKECIPKFVGRAKDLLTAEQLERFKKALVIPCGEDDRPQAPPTARNG